jgi:N-acyl-L-homoserine lactone synthetase
MSPRKPRQNPVALFAAAGYLMRDLGVKQLVAVFDKTMIRSYRLSGVEPHVVGEMSMNTGAVYAGIWSFSPEQLTQLTKKSGRRAHEFELSLANASFIENRHLAYG